MAISTDYLTLQDLYNNTSAARTQQLFDDDCDGNLTNEDAQVQRILRAAEQEVASHMLRAWDRDGIIALAGVDEAFVAHVAWIALELASERRPEFTAEDGKGQFWTQYERALKYVDSLSKGTKRTVGESAAGAASTTGGKLRPTETAGTAAAFVFAPSNESPGGHGGYGLPFAVSLGYAVYQAALLMGA